MDNGSRFYRNSHTIPKPALHKTLAKFIAGLAGKKEELAENLNGYATKVIEQETGSKRKRELEQILELNGKRMEQILSADIVDEVAIAQISEEYDKLQKELEQLGVQREAMEQENAYLQGIKEYIQNADFDTIQYDDKLVREVIESIIVKSADKLYIRVKGGYETEVILLEE